MAKSSSLAARVKKLIAHAKKHGLPLPEGVLAPPDQPDGAVDAPEMAPPEQPPAPAAEQPRGQRRFWNRGPGEVPPAVNPEARPSTVFLPSSAIPASPCIGERTAAGLRPRALPTRVLWRSPQQAAAVAAEAAPASTWVAEVPPSAYPPYVFAFEPLLAAVAEERKSMHRKLEELEALIPPLTQASAATNRTQSHAWHQSCIAASTWRRSAASRAGRVQCSPSSAVASLAYSAARLDGTVGPPLLTLWDAPPTHAAPG